MICAKCQADKHEAYFERYRTGALNQWCDDCRGKANRERQRRGAAVTNRRLRVTADERKVTGGDK